MNLFVQIQQVTGKPYKLQFDEDLISYEELLIIFWRQIDPTDSGGQFFDRGESYETAIFTHTEEQRLLAEKSKEELEASGKFDKPIATEDFTCQNFLSCRRRSSRLLHEKSYAL